MGCGISKLDDQQAGQEAAEYKLVRSRKYHDELDEALNKQLVQHEKDEEAESLGKNYGGRWVSSLRNNRAFVKTPMAKESEEKKAGSEEKLKIFDSRKEVENANKLTEKVKEEEADGSNKGDTCESEDSQEEKLLFDQTRKDGILLNCRSLSFKDYCIEIDSMDDKNESSSHHSKRKIDPSQGNATQNDDNSEKGAAGKQTKRGKIRRGLTSVLHSIRVKNLLNHPRMI